ncbi:hypothetical protein EB118_18825 [bacterium]|nr:hypothetical protein [Actinomycetota bacterium]NDG32115.1 hypothetical protein [bacterium]
MEEIDKLRVQPWKHFQYGMKDFFRTDKARLFQIVGIFQYTILYGVICFYFGAFLESLFPNATDDKDSWKIAMEVLGQCFILALALFYIRLFVKAIPALPTVFLPSKSRGISDLSTASYSFSEYQGELIVSIIFIGVQLNLLSKISILAKRTLNSVGLNKVVLLFEGKY